MSEFKAWRTTTKVYFRIDHQTFEVNYYPADKGDPEVRFNAPRRKWYVKQLTTALKRLAESGKKKKAHGSKNRATKKPKAREAVKHR